MRSHQTRVLEVITHFGDDVLSHRNVNTGQSLTIGPNADCDVAVSETIAPEPIKLITAGASGAALWAPPGSQLTMVDFAGNATSIIGEGRYVALDSQSAAELTVGSLTFQVRYTDVAQAVPGSKAWDWRGQRGTALSLGVHLTLLIFIAAIPPDGHALNIDRYEKQAIMIDFNSKPEKDTPPEWLQKAKALGGGGKAAPGKKGAMGDKKAPKVRKRYGVKGNHSKSQPVGPMDVSRVGILGLISASRSTALLLDASKTAIGADAETALGQIDGKQIGQAYGVFGLNVDGIGRGGGCEGLNCGSVGVGGSDFGRIGWRNAPTSGWGLKGGKPGSGNHKAKAPPFSVGRVKLKGTLSKSIIRRVVRRHLNQVKHCFERELVNERNLGGRLVVRFMIMGNGTVGTSQISESTIGNRNVETCVSTAVRRWAFPAPEGGGLVDVSYPFAFRRAGSK